MPADRISNKGTSESDTEPIAALRHCENCVRKTGWSCRSPHDMFWTVTRSRVSKGQFSEQSTMQHCCSQILHPQDSSKIILKRLDFVLKTLTPSGLMFRQRCTTMIFQQKLNSKGETNKKNEMLQGSENCITKKLFKSCFSDCFKMLQQKSVLRSVFFHAVAFSHRETRCWWCSQT